MKVRTIDSVLTGKQIKEMCEQKGLTVKEIQNALGLTTPQSIYNWFSDKSNSIPSIDHLVMLSMLLDCKVDDLLVVKDNIVVGN